MIGRALTYPIAAIIVPVGWWFRAARPQAVVPVRARHPARAPVPDRRCGKRVEPLRHDRLVGRPEPLRQLGDPRAAFGQLLLRLGGRPLGDVRLAVGFGAVTAVLWEFAEYFTFIRNSPELPTAYTDTLGDLALGLAGSAAAAALTVTVLGKRRSGRFTHPARTRDTQVRGYRCSFPLGGRGFGWIPRVERRAKRQAGRQGKIRPPRSSNDAPSALTRTGSVTPAASPAGAR